MFPYYSLAQQNYVSPYCGNAFVGRSFNDMTYFILIYVILSIHSGYYLVKGITKEYDFTTGDLFQLVIAVLIPIMSHIATYITYYHKPNERVLFRRRS